MNLYWLYWEVLSIFPFPVHDYHHFQTWKSHQVAVVVPPPPARPTSTMANEEVSEKDNDDEITCEIPEYLLYLSF